MAQPQETLLVMDAEAIRKAIRRIAHEIIERNDDLSRVVIAGIPTRGVEIARRIVEHIETNRRACGPDSASWTSRCTVTTFPHVEGQRRSSPHSFPSTSRDGQSFWSMTCFLPGGAVARRWMRLLRSAGQRAFNMPFSWIGDIASCPFARITSGRIFRPLGKSESACDLKTSMAPRIASRW